VEQFGGHLILRVKALISLEWKTGASVEECPFVGSGRTAMGIF
jgi:hypothetical protein